MKKTLTILLLLIAQTIFSQTGGRRFFTETFNVNAATPLELTDNLGQPLIQGNMYKVQLVTTGTGTKTGAEYLVWYSSTTALWQLRAVSMSGAGSNYPLLILDNNIVKVSMLHTTKYYVKAFVEEIISEETDALPYMFGASYHWQKEPSKLYYMDGNVGIGTTVPSNKLDVNGTIHAKEVKVDLAGWPDYVFEKYYLGESSLKPDYTMLSLSEVQKFTEKNHHLPNVPSAKEIKENGLHLGEMSNILLQKIEELTLYSIEQQKIIERQAAAIEKLEKQNESSKKLEERLAVIEKELNTKK